MFHVVDQEHHFQDKYLFYRFLDDEHEDAPLPTEEEKKECDEELQDTMLLLSQMGPDAHMRMILRKPWVRAPGSPSVVPRVQGCAGTLAWATGK